MLWLTFCLSRLTLPSFATLLQFSCQLLLESHSHPASFCVSLSHCSLRRYYMFLHSTCARHSTSECSIDWLGSCLYTSIHSLQPLQNRARQHARLKAQIQQYEVSALLLFEGKKSSFSLCCLLCFHSFSVMTKERGSLRKILPAETETLSLHVVVPFTKINPNPRQIGAEHGKLELISSLSAWPGTNMSRKLRSHRIIIECLW